MTEFSDKTIVITGASSGIGAATAVRMAREGAKIALCARNEERLDKVAALVKEAGGKPFKYVLDVSDRSAVQKVFSHIKRDCGGMDVVINNAGIGYIGPVETMSEADMRRVMDVNFFGVINCTQAAIPHMKGNAGGLIVLVSSILGKRAMPSYGVYSASKFAVAGLSEALRLELAEYGIKVLLVCPTATDTGFFDNAGWDGKASRQLRGPVVMTAEAVAEQVYRSLVSNRRECVLSLPARLFHWLNFFCPSLVDFVVKRIMRK